MIFIVVEGTIRPDRSDEWLALTDDFTQATRNEEDNLFSGGPAASTSTSVRADGGIRIQRGRQPHVNSEHFRTAMARMPDVIAGNPEIIHVEVPQDGSSRMSEVSPRGQQE